MEALLRWAVGDVEADAPEVPLAALVDAPPRDGTAPALREVAAAAYDRVPGRGVRALAVGHAVVGLLAGLGHEGARELVRLWDGVHYARPRAAIDKALRATVTELRVPAAELAREPATSTLDDRLGHELRAGGCVARIEVGPDLRRVRTVWRGPDGAPRARPPAAARHDREAFDRISLERRRLQRVVTERRAGLERALREGGTERVEDWVGRWFSDPLDAALARRMVWAVGDVAVVPRLAGMETVEGALVRPEPDAQIGLWHPAEDAAGRSAWVRRLHELDVVQPVAQAGREVFGSEVVWEDWCQQAPLRAFLRRRGWHVPYLGPFFTVPEARRGALPGGPVAVAYLDWRAEDGYVRVAGVGLETATGESLGARELPARWVSDAARDVTGAILAGLG